MQHSPALPRPRHLSRAAFGVAVAGLAMLVAVREPALALVGAIAAIAVFELAARWRRRIDELDRQLQAKTRELAQLQQAMAETGQMLSKSSHDLNNALGIVIGLATLPADEVCPDDLCDIAAAAQRGVELSRNLSKQARRS